MKALRSTRCLVRCYLFYKEAVLERKLQEATIKLERVRRANLLLPDHGLEKISRYEAHLERSLYKAAVCD